MQPVEAEKQMLDAAPTELAKISRVGGYKHGAPPELFELQVRC